MAKRTSSKSSREFCFSCLEFNHVKFVDTALLLMPAPLSCQNVAEGLDAELRMICGVNYFPDTGLVKAVSQAEKEGRVIFGWSPWRAKTRTLNWATWDDFIMKWCSLAPALAERPATYCLKHLCREIATLESSGILKVIGKYPIDVADTKNENQTPPRAKRKKKPKRERVNLEEIEEPGENEEIEISDDF